MKENIYIIIVVLLLLYSCKSDNNKFSEFYTSKYLNTEMVLSKIGGFTIGKENYTEWTHSGDLLIGRLFPFFVSTNNPTLHAFRDEVNQHVIVIDDHGNVQAVVGSIGRGPKEFSKIEMYNFRNHEELFISDMGSLVYKVMNLDNELLSTIDFDLRTFGTQSIFNIYYYNDYYYKPIVERKLGADFKNHWKSALIAKYDTSGNVVSVFGNYDHHLKNPASYTTGPSIYLDYKREKLFSIHTNNHQIQVFDLNTEKRIKWFGHKPKHFNYPDVYIDAFLPREQIMNRIAGTSSSDRVFTCERFIYHSFMNMSIDFFDNRDFNKHRYFLAIYDADTFDYHGEVEIPYVIGNIVNGKIYLIENDNPDNYTIGIYQIAIID